MRSLFGLIDNQPRRTPRVQAGTALGCGRRARSALTSAVKRCQRIGGTIQAGGKSSRSQILSSRWACLARSRTGSHARLLYGNHRTGTLGNGGRPVDCRGVHRCRHPRRSRGREEGFCGLSENTYSLNICVVLYTKTIYNV